MKIKLFIIFIIACLFLSNNAIASQNLFYKEVNIIGGYSDNEDWIGKSSTLKNSVGFEDYRKFSNDYGDFLTTNLQMRIAYDSIEDDRDAYSAEIHNAWLEYKISSGKNLKVGHFDPAFGLEPVLDTHGTLLQTQAMDTIGFKKDWGIAFKGLTEKWDHKTALQLGSGMTPRRKDGSFLFTSRIGNPQYEDFNIGASVLYGEVLNARGMQTIPANDLLSNRTVTKKRIGWDIQYLYLTYDFKSEISYGADDSNEVLGFMQQIEYTVPDNQQFKIGLQFKTWINDLAKSRTDDTTVNTVLSYHLDKNKTIRLGIFHDIERYNAKKDDKVLLQFYYFGI